MPQAVGLRSANEATMGKLIEEATNDFESEVNSGAPELY
jgi:hypothetical protein